MTGEIIECNNAYSKMLGYTFEELKHLTYQEITPVKWHEFENKIIEQVIKNGHSDIYKKEYIKKDGTIFPVELRSILIKDDFGQPQSMWAIIRDISVRESAEKALKESEAKWKRLVETANEGVWRINADNNTEFVNQKMADMLGYTPEEMNGKTLFDFMDDEGKKLAAENVERRKQGIKEQHDFKFQRKDGTDLWCIVSTNPILDENGNYQGALGMMTDVTDRKRLE
jgi:PAS domain S-box-containing protein